MRMTGSRVERDFDRWVGFRVQRRHTLDVVRIDYENCARAIIFKVNHDAIREPQFAF